MLSRRHWGLRNAVRSERRFAPGFYCGTSTCRKYCFDASDCESGECNPLGTPTFAADRLLGFCTDP